jgi:hypothetical protein
MPTKTDRGDVWHGIPYDEEVIDGVYTHMAIVEKPRYEFAKIYELDSSFHNSMSEKVLSIYQNSKEDSMKKKKKIFHLFKNNIDAETEKKPEDEIVEEEKVNMDDAILEIEGEQVPLSEVITAYKEEKAEDETSEEGNNVINPEDEIDIGDGEKVLASELIASYQRRASKTNAELPTDTTMEETVDEKAQKENSKKPNDNFKALNNSIKESFANVKLIVNSKVDRINKGKQKYGSGKEVKE